MHSLKRFRMVLISGFLTNDETAVVNTERQVKFRLPFPLLLQTVRSLLVELVSRGRFRFVFCSHFSQAATRGDLNATAPPANDADDAERRQLQPGRARRWGQRVAVGANAKVDEATGQLVGGAANVVHEPRAAKHGHGAGLAAPVFRAGQGQRRGSGTVPWDSPGQHDQSPGRDGAAPGRRVLLRQQFGTGAQRDSAPAVLYVGAIPGRERVRAPAAAAGAAADGGRQPDPRRQAAPQHRPPAQRDDHPTGLRGHGHAAVAQRGAGSAAVDAPQNTPAIQVAVADTRRGTQRKRQPVERQGRQLAHPRADAHERDDAGGGGGFARVRDRGNGGRHVVAPRGAAAPLPRRLRVLPRLHDPAQGAHHQRAPAA